MPFQVSCGGCAACRDGRFAACHTHRAPVGAAFGFGPRGGGHGGAVADLLLVPAGDRSFTWADGSRRFGTWEHSYVNVLGLGSAVRQALVEVERIATAR